MSQPKLSFCIPTYNFGSFIGQTLQSIIDQADDRVEIVVIDGGSTDQTEAVVNEKRTLFPHIRYINVGRGRGVDRDIVETVAQARGEYCWLLSSDDVLEPGSVSRMMDEIGRGYDVILCDFWICDLELKPMYPHRPVTVDRATTFDWSKPADRAHYLASARTTTAFFSFISGIILRRTLWDGLTDSDRFLGSCWIIAARMFDAARNGLVVRYLPETLLLKRGDNDSFSSRGMIWRLELSIKGFQRVAETYWGPDSPEAVRVRRTLQAEYPISHFLGYKLQLARLRQTKDWPGLYAVADYLYSDTTIIDRYRRMLVRIVPVFMLRMAVPFYRVYGATRRWFGSLRLATR